MNRPALQVARGNRTRPARCPRLAAVPLARAPLPAAGPQAHVRAPEQVRVARARILQLVAAERTRPVKVAQQQVLLATVTVP